MVAVFNVSVVYLSPVALLGGSRNGKRSSTPNSNWVDTGLVLQTKWLELFAKFLIYHICKLKVLFYANI